MDIKKTERSALKNYFSKNAMPTAANFAELIDGMINQKEDGIVKLAGQPLSVQADGNDASQKKTINFYKNFADSKPSWTLSLNPRVNPDDAATARPGWSVGDAEGNSKLFIDQSTGNLGVGTVQPLQRLHVAGNALFGSTFLGDVGHGSSWAGLAHGSSATAAGYGFLHHVTGQYSVINKKSGGGYIGLRVDNVDKMVLDDAGNVGIGTTAPKARLDVNGTLNLNGTATKDPDSAMNNGGNLVVKSAAPQIDFVDTDHNDWSIHVNSNKMYFIRQPWNYQDLVLDGNGNVGIGTDAPASKLDVRGDINVGGNVNVSGNVSANGLPAGVASEALYTVRGIVNPNGSAAHGTGYKVTRASVGVFDIYFTPAFQNYPAVVATQLFPGDVNNGGGDTRDNAVVVGITPARVRIKTGDGGGGASDRWFSFIAMASR